MILKLKLSIRFIWPFDDDAIRKIQVKESYNPFKHNSTLVAIQEITHELGINIGSEHSIVQARSGSEIRPQDASRAEATPRGNQSENIRYANHGPDFMKTIIVDDEIRFCGLYLMSSVIYLETKIR